MLKKQEHQLFQGVLTTSPISRNENTTVIQPAKGWSSLQLHELWEYRDLLYFMVTRDLKTRYRQTALGPIWILIAPITNMLLYTILFGVIAKLPSDGVPYPVFTYVALLPWSFFASTLQSASASLAGSQNLMNKVYFPHLLVPISQIISGLVDFAVSFLVLIVLMAYYHIVPTWNVLWVPFFILVAATIGLGVGLWFAGIIVRYRDFGQLIGMLIRFWMYGTPVVYALSVVPVQLQTIYKLNPMTGVVEGFRWSLLGTGSPPDWTFVVSILIIIPILICGLYVFRRVERNIIDIA